MKKDQYIDLMQPVFLYVLRDPRDGAIRYAGKSYDAENRLQQHVRDAQHRDNPLHRWIRKLQKEGVTPECEVVAETINWQDDERELIAVLRARGERLLNVADGGNQPYCPPDVLRANGYKVAQMRRDDPRARRIWELKRSLGSALKAGHVNNRTRAKMRLAANKNPKLFGAWANIPDRVEA